MCIRECVLCEAASHREFCVAFVVLSAARSIAYVFGFIHKVTTLVLDRDTEKERESRVECV